MQDLLIFLNETVVVLVLLLFALGSVAIKSARSGMARMLLIGLVATMLAGVMTMPVQLMSYAKPTTVEWINRDVPEAQVLHAELRENVGIFLLLDWYGVPRYYVLDWNQELAKQLMKAMKKAKEQTGETQESTQQAGGGGENGSEAQDQANQTTGSVNGAEKKAKGTMITPGHGTVMMRNPFKDPKLDESRDGASDAKNGKGPAGSVKDIESEAMFYAKPPPGYPVKELPKVVRQLDPR